MGPPLQEPVRVLAIADSDSYLKWSDATLRRLPGQWDRRQVLLSSPIAPSPSQVRAATGADLPPLPLASVLGVLRHGRPDVVLVAATGPTVAALTALPALRGPGRPVLVTGLPGLSVPASARAVDLRRDCDLLVVHSRRERREFTTLAATRAPGLAVALGRLPFLGGTGAAPARGAGGSVVFAAQAKVPPRREDREAILLALADLPPPGTAVVKVRALPGEQQTHHEELPYPRLWDDLITRRRDLAGSVRFVAGSMADALADARCLVTVSSTAALEAMDAGVPVVVLRDFGVGSSMINLVFEHSGCLGTLADVRAGRGFVPAPAWLVDNYFHPPADDDLPALVADLLGRRQAGELPRRPARVPGAARLRSLARLALPAPLGRLLRRAQEVRGAR